MNHLRKFNENSEYGDHIQLTTQELKYFDRHEQHPNYPGLTFDCDTDSGEFDAEKGAMYNYDINLYDESGNIWSGKGGYYTGITGHVFSYPVNFRKRIKEINIENWFSDFMRDTKLNKEEALKKLNDFKISLLK